MVLAAFVTSGGKIECNWKRPSDADWQTSPPIAGDETSTYLLQVPDGHTILIRARAVNASGRSSPWETISHAVQGKSAAPSDATGLAGVTLADAWGRRELRQIGRAHV